MYSVLMFALHVGFLSYVYLLLVCYAHDFPCSCMTLSGHTWHRRGVTVGAGLDHLYV